MLRLLSWHCWQDWIFAHLVGEVGTWAAELLNVENSAAGISWASLAWSGANTENLDLETPSRVSTSL